MKAFQNFLLRLSLLMVVILFSQVSRGQISINGGFPYNSPQYLVQNVLVGGGVTTMNWNFQGNPLQMAFFSNAATTIGIDSGIVLSSGNTGLIGNNVTGIISGAYQGPGDPDLLAVAQSVIGTIQNTRDRAVLTFDFIAPTDTIKFDYVFASEEWPNYVNTWYNDAFGFFISGPGITGPYTNNATNVALLPGTTTPITISTIHATLNTQYYIQNNNFPPFAFFAYTTVLTTAPMVVNPCDTFHMKLAIADGTDWIFDSAVFLKAKSFVGQNILLSANPTYSNYGNDSTMYEHCGGATLTFERSGSTSFADTIDILVQGTATNGVDYTYIPDSVIFPIGQNQATISFNVFSDTLTEGLESLTLVIPPDSSNLSCVNDTTFLHLYIDDPLPIDFHLTADTSLNCTQPGVNLTIDSVSGLLPLTYLWSTGDTDSTIYANPPNTQMYYVTVTDACQADTVVDSVQVQIYTPPFTITTTGDTINCTETATISVAIDTNNYPGIQYLWSTGDTTTSIQVSPNVTTPYTVSVSLPCANLTVVGVAVVDVVTPPFVTQAVNDYDTINCTSDSVDIGIAVVANWLPGINYSWASGQTDSIITVWAGNTTTYTISTTLACAQQTVVDTLTLVVQNDPVSIISPDIPAGNIECPGDPVNIFAVAGGGYPGYNYAWSNGATTPATVVTPMTTTTYQVSVTDTCGLVVYTENVIVNVPVYPPLEVLGLEDDTVNCPEDFIAFGPPQMTPNGGIGYGYQFSWNNWVDTNPNLSHQPLGTTTYTVQLTDFCAQDTAVASVTATITPHQSLQLDMAEDVNICLGEEAVIWGHGYDGGGEYRYLWSNMEITDSITVKPIRTTTYELTMYDDCDTARVGEVTVHLNMPDARYEYAYEDAYTVQFVDFSSADVTKWFWNFDNGEGSNLQNPKYTYEISDNYWVQLIVENDYGCQDSIGISLTPPLQFWLPKAFSPNNDGINDYFEAKGLGVDDFEIDIFDRWGLRVFSTSDPNFRWDGTHRGEALPIGVYVWKIYATGFNNQKEERTGTVTIVNN